MRLRFDGVAAFEKISAIVVVSFARSVVVEILPSRYEPKPAVKMPEVLVRPWGALMSGRFETRTS